MIRDVMIYVLGSYTLRADVTMNGVVHKNVNIYHLIDLKKSKFPQNILNKLVVPPNNIIYIDRYDRCMRELLNQCLECGSDDPQCICYAR